MIQERIGVPSSELRLSCKTKPIEPEDILVEMGVEVNSTVLALLRIRAGSHSDSNYAYSREFEAQPTAAQAADGTADLDEEDYGDFAVLEDDDSEVEQCPFEIPAQDSRLLEDDSKDEQCQALDSSAADAHEPLAPPPRARLLSTFSDNVPPEA